MVTVQKFSQTVRFFLIVLGLDDIYNKFVSGSSYNHPGKYTDYLGYPCKYPDIGRRYPCKYPDVIRSLPAQGSQVHIPVFLIRLQCYVYGKIE